MALARSCPRMPRHVMWERFSPLRAALALVAGIGAIAWPLQGQCGWQTFNSRSGLPPFAVRCVFQDRSEVFWFGTSGGGVARYDGATWKVFTESDGLAGNTVTSIEEDRQGGMWFGCLGGVSHFDGATWETTRSANGLEFGSVSTVLEDRSGTIWVAFSGGVSRFDGSTWSTFGTQDGLGSSTISCMLEDRVGNLWFGFFGGVTRYDGITWRTFTSADGVSPAPVPVTSILEDRSGNMWFGTDGGGVSRFDGISWKTFTPLDGLIDGSVTSLLEDQTGEILIGTGFGVSRFDGSVWSSVRTADGLASDRVTALYLDRSGNLWFGTYDAGVSRFDGSSWRTVSAVGGIWRIVDVGAGTLWFGTEGGVGRYDGSTWTTFTTADGLAGDDTRSLLVDRGGNIWAGSMYGASRYDGTAWRTYTTSDGLAADWILCILEDRSGNIWLGTYGGGVSRYDGATWRTFTVADGLPADIVESIAEDAAGNIWCRTNGGLSSSADVCRFDGSSWKVITTSDGLAADKVSWLLSDRSGTLWFGTYGAGLSRYDGVTWKTFTVADGLGGDNVTSIIEGQPGDLWFVTDGGLSRYDGSIWSTLSPSELPPGADLLLTSFLEEPSGTIWIGTHNGVNRYGDGIWSTFTTTDGLLANDMTAMVQDSSGDLWFGTSRGVTRYEPDRVPPQSVFLSSPASASPSRRQSARFGAAFGELDGIEFSYRFDQGSWSGWSSASSWFQDDLPDGIHTLELRSRDLVGNVESTPATIMFEVDATAPAPLITAPPFGSVVRGMIFIQGSADDPRLQEYRLEARPYGATTWNPPVGILLAQSSAPVSDGRLAAWDTTQLPDGLYDLRLSATDSLGLTGSAQATIVIDNHAPFADVTAPAVVSAAKGGDIFTTNSEAHLYFPPHAFSLDALVMIEALSTGAVPDTLPSGGVRVGGGYNITWGVGSLVKAARLDLSYAGASLPSGTLAVDWSSDGVTWKRLGGTLEPDAKRIVLPATAAGRYALFAEPSPYQGEGGLSGMSFSPRVFSPTGGFGDQQVGIGFTLGRPATVTIKVYSRSGRLVREVVSNRPMTAGSNLVRWDGIDREGRIVIDGLYLITIEALGEIKRQTLAVVK